MAIPPSWSEDSLEYREWYSLTRQVEDTYCKWIERGIRPEEARTVLQNCLKSELYMAANLRELRHIIKLRTDKAAHPQMRLIAGMILDILRDKLPVIVEDISHE